MKKILSILIAFLPLLAWADNTISVGVRQNRHVFGEFLLKDHYLFRLEQSVYSQKIGFQTLRADVAYTGAVGGLRYTCGLYFGGAYNRSYGLTGAKIGLDYTAFRRLIVMGELNPHYDSGLKYKTCFSAGLGVLITKAIDIKAAYTTIPEYRMSEKRVRAGFDFHVAHLAVVPEVSMSVSGNDKYKTLRALMSFKYSF